MNNLHISKVHVADSMIMSCSCPMFSHSKQACKHMFLVRRWHGSLLIHGDYAAQTIQFNNASLFPSCTLSSDTTNDQSRTPPERAEVDVSSSPSPLSDFQAAKRQFNRAINQANIPEDQMHVWAELAEQMRQMTIRIQQSSVVPSNSHFTRQQ